MELQTNENGNLNTLPLDSDHKAISVYFSIHNDELELNSTENHSLNYNKADWKKFKIILTRSTFQTIEILVLMKLMVLQTH